MVSGSVLPVVVESAIKATLEIGLVNVRMTAF